MKPVRFYLVAGLVTLGLILAVSWSTAVRAETLRYSGQLFEFPHKRMVFIDLTNADGTKIGPLIIDKKKSPADAAKFQDHPLNVNGAFILRFVLQNVDPELIKKIYMAEYNVSEDVAISDINAFLDDLTGKNGKPALLVKANRKADTRPEGPKTKPHTHFAKPLKINLDVNLNLMGGGGFKIPPR
jgi:hypothetical protein